MTTTTSTPPIVDQRHGPATWLWGLFGLLLVTQVPLFLCQHLTSDAVVYDLQARCALDGGVLYRDIVEPNLPGVVWLHMVVRSLLGWSWLALRAVDLFMLGMTTWLLALWVTPNGETWRSVRTAGLALAIFSLYFSLSEWCHCQRDLWMLLPCMGAMHLRLRTVQELRASTSNHSIQEKRSFIWRSLGEGVLWGTAFWLKPHVAVPAACVLSVSLYLTGFNRKTWTDLIAVICGGILIGAVGSAWLIRTGAWPHFWEMQLEWNPEYLKAGRQRMSLRWLWGLFMALAPWSWAEVLALGTLFRLGWTWKTSRSLVPGNARAAVVSPQEQPLDLDTLKMLLLGSLFFGWMAQILALQHPFAYVQVPGLVLALSIVASWRVPQDKKPIAWMAAAGCGCLVLLTSPIIQPSRLGSWWACVTHGPTWDVRSQVQMEIQPDWKELRPVIEYLKDRHLQDGELAVYSGRLIHLYSELGLRPPTRYVYLDVLTHLFKDRAPAIQQALEVAPIRYVVSSLREDGMPRAAINDVEDPSTHLPVCFPESRRGQFPYSQPVVFRSGEYLVHQVDGPLGVLSPEVGPLAQVRPASAFPSR